MMQRDKEPAGALNEIGPDTQVCVYVCVCVDVYMHVCIYGAR